MRYFFTLVLVMSVVGSWCLAQDYQNLIMAKESSTITKKDHRTLMKPYTHLFELLKNLERISQSKNMYDVADLINDMRQKGLITGEDINEKEVSGESATLEFEEMVFKMQSKALHMYNNLRKLLNEPLADSFKNIDHPWLIYKMFAYCWKRGMVDLLIGSSHGDGQYVFFQLPGNVKTELTSNS